MKFNDRFCIMFKDGSPYIIDSRGQGEEYKITDPKILYTISSFFSGEDIFREPSDEVNKMIDLGIFINDDYEDECCLDILSQLYFAASRESVGLNDSVSREEVFKRSILQTIKNKKGKKFPKRNMEQYSEFHELPAPTKDGIDQSFFKLLKNRKTYRVFEKDFSVSLQSLSNILHICLGPFHGYEIDLPKNIFRRTCPMNGGLRSINAYLFIFNVEGLREGIYFYDCELHRLCLIRNIIDYSEIRGMMHSQEFAENCSFAMSLVADIRVQTWKYTTSRNVKVLFIDAGCLVQNLQLVATSENIQTWISGAMNCDAMEDLLKVNSNSEVALFFVAFGRSTKTYDLDFINKCYKELKVDARYNEFIPPLLDY